MISVYEAVKNEIRNMAYQGLMDVNEYTLLHKLRLFFDQTTSNPEVFIRDALWRHTLYPQN